MRITYTIRNKLLIAESPATILTTAITTKRMRLLVLLINISKKREKVTAVMAERTMTINTDH